MIGTPEIDDKESRINAHLMVGYESCSLAKECKRLYDEEERVNDVTGHHKHKKREEKNKLKNIIYHLQDKYDVEMVGIIRNLVALEKEI